MKIQSSIDINTILNDIQKTEGPGRGRIGPSMMGHPCDRLLWLLNKGKDVKVISGRTNRIFRHGHIIEDLVVNDLRLAGLDIVDDKEKLKIAINYKGHRMIGELDGVIKSGVPGAPRKKHVLEVKSSNDKAFKDLIKNGVQKSKPQHYIQMQLYMYATGQYGKIIDRAFYVVVNKNDDSYYTERVEFDKIIAEYQLDRWVHIIESKEMPMRISQDPSWYQCKFCDMYGYCFK